MFKFTENDDGMFTVQLDLDCYTLEDNYEYVAVTPPIGYDEYNGYVKMNLYPTMLSDTYMNIDDDGTISISSIDHEDSNDETFSFHSYNMYQQMLWNEEDEPRHEDNKETSYDRAMKVIE